VQASVPAGLNISHTKTIFMNRSRIFLGFTAACLAITGAIAAKAYTHKQKGWYATKIILGQWQCTKLALTGCQYSSIGFFYCTVGNFPFNSILYTAKGILTNNFFTNFKYFSIDD